MKILLDQVQNLPSPKQVSTHYFADLASLSGLETSESKKRLCFFWSLQVGFGRRYKHLEELHPLIYNFQAENINLESVG